MKNNNHRYPKGIFTSYTTNFIHHHNPNVIAWWSAALPGFGHIAQCKFINGILLVIWEFYTNVSSHLNEAIVYSLTGQFELAKKVLNLRVFFLYFPVYLFTIWDSRNIAIEINQLAILSDRNDEYLPTPLIFSGPELNYLAIRNPLKAAIWSIVCPGLGHIYINRMIMGYFLLPLFMLTLYNSKILCAIPLLILGNLNEATHIVSKEWIMFFPSIYAFSIFDSYRNAVEYTKLFKNEKVHYYKQAYAFTKKDFEEVWER